MKQTFKLNRHYTYVASNHIARKLFICHRCSNRCSPSEFRSFNKLNGKDLYIASSYDCRTCGLRFIVNMDLFDNGSYKKRF